MAISSGKAQGEMTMYVVPQSSVQKNYVKTAGGMSVLENFGSQSRLQSLVVDAISASEGNYQDAYQNPDLESALVDRGLSQLRPEIIGCFEFNSPVTEDMLEDNGTLTQETYSTAAAQMFDLQCQLKQLRYAEVLEFLKQQLNLRTVSAGTDEGVRLAPKRASRTGRGRVSGITQEEREKAQSYLQPFNEEMTTAKDIIEWLTVAYNSISEVLYAMDVKSNDYIDSPGDSSMSSIIEENIEMFDSDYISSVIGTLTLKDYMINGSGGSSVLKLPDSWWETATPTSVVAQLLNDSVIKLLYPFTTYWN
ncbi:hypothetical protein CL634_10745, partial [bacterium]|nr:hypothetical protein [bacterium]